MTATEILGLIQPDRSNQSTRNWFYNMDTCNKARYLIGIVKNKLHTSQVITNYSKLYDILTGILSAYESHHPLASICLLSDIRDLPNSDTELTQLAQVLSYHTEEFSTK